MMKVFITGGAGMVGSHLADLCLEEGMEVHLILRHTTNKRNIEHCVEDLNLHLGDIKDYGCVKAIVDEVEPDLVFHLAAMSFVPQSFVASSETLYNNIVGTDNVLKAIDDVTRCAIACSSEEYGMVYPTEVPIQETNPLRPRSPYGISKVATDYLGAYYAGLGKKIVRLRCFNTEGPRRHELFVTSTFAKQIAEIEKGKRRLLLHGNLDVVRDFTDVRDIVRAYRLAVDKCEYGDVYNVCSGEGHSIEEVLDFLISEAYKSKGTTVMIKTDSARMRESEVPLLLGDCTKFKEATGWKPEISFEQMLLDELEWWRERV